MKDAVLTKNQQAALRVAVVVGLQEAFDSAIHRSEKEIGYKTDDLKDACFRIGLGDEYQEIISQ